MLQPAPASDCSAVSDVPTLCCCGNPTACQSRPTAALPVAHPGAHFALIDGPGITPSSSAVCARRSHFTSFRLLTDRNSSERRDGMLGGCARCPIPTWQRRCRRRRLVRVPASIGIATRGPADLFDEVIDESLCDEMAQGSANGASTPAQLRSLAPTRCSSATSRGRPRRRILRARNACLARREPCASPKKYATRTLSRAAVSTRFR